MKREEFDERQLWIRGNIFMHMFFVTAGALVVDAFVQDAYGPWAPGRYGSLLILALIVAAGSIEMIVKEVYIVQPRLQRMFVVLMLAAGLALLVLNIIHTVWDGFSAMRGGMLSTTLCSLVLGLLYLSIPVAFLAQRAVARRRDAGEE